MNGEPHKVTATLKVVVTGEFYGEVSEETLRYFVEQDLEDDGFDVDVELLKEQGPKTIPGFPTMEGVVIGNCPRCDRLIVGKENDPAWFCKYCGQAVKWI